MSQSEAPPAPSPEEGRRRAVDLLDACATEDGFFATTVEVDNYRRVWSRDGCIMGLAALLTDRPPLHEACRRTLETLAGHQGPHGEIPSNVDVRTGRVSYGGTTGRLDGNLWFIICAGRYLDSTGDVEFLRKLAKPLARVRFLLGAWEYNNRGLLYVPVTGDWADEYLHNGYVLYDQLLYLEAQRNLIVIGEILDGERDPALERRVGRLVALIRDNYWLTRAGDPPKNIYHEVLYEKGRRAAHRCDDVYWAPFFSPVGYGYRFDTLANALASLLGVADRERSESVDRYVEGSVLDEEVMLLPAFHPVITPRDEDWSDLQMTFSYSFKNAPYQFHNGGLWPMVTGFYAASLALRGRTKLARRCLDGIHRANALPMEDAGAAWGFPEYLHGRDHTPEGTPRLGWSAAAAVIADAYLDGRRLFVNREV